MSALDTLKAGVAACIATNGGGNTYDSCRADFWARLEVASTPEEMEEAYEVFKQCITHLGASAPLLACIDIKWQAYIGSFA